MRLSARKSQREGRCPRCHAASGSPCIGAQGKILDGVHFQRTTQKRRDIKAALNFYASMNLRRERTAPR